MCRKVLIEPAPMRCRGDMLAFFAAERRFLGGGMSEMSSEERELFNNLAARELEREFGQT